MSDEIDAKSTTLIGPKSKEELAAELAKAANSQANQEREAQLGGAIDNADKKDLEELTGRDLDFDPKTFVTYGAIRQENIKIIDNPDPNKKMVVDMQSLTQRDRIVAEQLVKARFGNLSASDNVYNTAMESAIIAMSITRINNTDYPMPTMALAAKDAKSYAETFDSKLKVYDMILDANEKFVGFLSVLYNKLENADILKELKEGVDVAKKSGAPSSPSSSGSSAAN